MNEHEWAAIGKFLLLFNSTGFIIWVLKRV